MNMLMTLNIITHFRLGSHLLVREDGLFLNIPVSLSLTLFFSRFGSCSLSNLSKLRSDPLGFTETLGISAYESKILVNK